MGEPALTREEWLERRRHYIGASDAAAALGMSTWKSRLDLYREKLGQFQENETEELRRGTVLEPVVARLHERRIGRRLVKGMWTKAQEQANDFMAAEPDYIDLPEGGDGSYVQIKTVNWWLREEWVDERGRDMIPDHYMIQVQHEMEVTGCPRNCLVALFADASTFRAAVAMIDYGLSVDTVADYLDKLIAMADAQCELVAIPAERDDQLVEQIVEGEREFWHGYVLANVEPPDASIPQKSPKILVADERQTEILMRLREMHDREKAAHERYEEIKGEVAREIGEHSGIVAEGIAKVNYKAGPPKEIVDYELAFAEVKRKKLADNCAAAQKANTVPATDWEAAFKDLDMSDEDRKAVRAKFATLVQPKRVMRPYFPGSRKAKE